MKPITKKIDTGMKAKDPGRRLEEFFKSGDKKLHISPAKLLKQKAHRNLVRQVLQLIKRDMKGHECDEFVLSSPQCELRLTYQLLQSYYCCYLP